MSEINLISKKRAEDLGSKKILGLLRLASITSLVLTSVFSVGIFFIKINSPLPSLKEEEKRLLTNLSSSKQQVAKIAILTDRLKTISGILSQRLDFDGLVNSLEAQAPQNIAIKAVTVDKKTVSFEVSSPSLNSLNILIENLAIMVSNKKMFGKITLRELTADPSLGEYAFSIDADLL